jgi:hypothetical protein
MPVEFRAADEPGVQTNTQAMTNSPKGDFTSHYKGLVVTLGAARVCVKQ